MSSLCPNKIQRRKATRRLFLRLCGTLLGAGAAVAVEARYIEPNALDVTRHEVFLPDLPAAMEGVTVAQLTDLHRGPHTPDATIHQAVAAVVALKPDLIVLTGDFVDGDPSDAVPLREMFQPLRARLGIWGCLGNHDYYGSVDQVAKTLTDSGEIRLLRNESHLLAPGFWIAGIEDTSQGYPDTPRALAAIPPGAATLFLTHNPVGVWTCTNRPLLALAGHTHGGQIRIPGLPPRLPPGMQGFPLVAGWGLFDRARLYISRGVGMSMLPLRLGSYPEVAFFTLRRGDSPPRTLPTLAGRAARKAERVLRSAAHHLA
ncbi:MAG: metallophosphoesterase [Cytophagales bacterium]|nr:metallophosphoesterase [Armatimonadota bacterium]